MDYRRRKGLSVLLSLTSSAGVIGTGILARRAAKKEEDEYETLLPFKKGNIKDILLINKLPILVGTVTIASIVGATILNRKREASLISMAVMADQGWRKYKYQVKELLGVKAHTDTLMGVARNDAYRVPSEIPDDDRQLYFEEHIGFFLADPEKLAYAYADMNQRLQVEDPGVSSYYTMLYDMVKGFEIIDKDYNPEDLQWGWTADQLSEMYGFVWVHWFFHEDQTPDGKTYTVIEWGEEPILNPGNYGECWLDGNSLDEQGAYHETESTKILKNRK